jgi:hypothetical protein
VADPEGLGGRRGRDRQQMTREIEAGQVILVG